MQDEQQEYSFGWAGGYPGEDSLNMLLRLYRAKDVPEVMDELHGNLGDRYRGIGMNTIFADNSGNIGYQMSTTY